MTLREAIGICTDLDTTLPQSSSEDRREALKLLIEAGKQIERCRTGNPAFVELPLPGETTE